MPRAYFEDYEVGERRETPGRTVTEADVINFAGLTGDWHPLHTDVTYAAETPFGERIAHGMLVLSAGFSLAFRLGQYEFLPQSFIAFAGMDNVRFTAPVKLGDTIHLEMEVHALEPVSGNRGIVIYRNEIVNQHGTPVCTFVSKILCGCQPR